MYMMMKFFDYKFLPSQILREDDVLLHDIISISAEVELFKAEQRLANGGF